MRYFLESPAAKGKKLMHKGQVQTMPIYHCHHSDTFWVLMMSALGKRHLVPYDPKSGMIDSSTSIAVPEDWEGEPQTIAIDHTTWQDLNHPDYSHQLRGIRDLIQNGDSVCLVNDSNQMTHVLSVDSSGNLTPRPITFNT